MGRVGLVVLILVVLILSHKHGVKAPKPAGFPQGYAVGVMVMHTGSKPRNTKPPQLDPPNHKVSKPNPNPPNPNPIYIPPPNSHTVSTRLTLQLPSRNPNPQAWRPGDAVSTGRAQMEKGQVNGVHIVAPRVETKKLRDWVWHCWFEPSE